jgi:copper chaperone CopZ
VSGNLVGAEARDRVLSNVRGHAEIKSVVDALDVRADSAEIKAMVERVMPELGLPNAHVEVDDNGRVTLSGPVDNDKQRVDATDAVQRLPGVTTVDSRFERSVAWRQRDVNRALADAGLTQVTASYQDDWTATLSGQVSDNESRERAELLVQTADVNAQVVNNIVVIAPAVEAAPSRPTQSARKPAHEVAATPAPEPPKMAADALLGTWVTAPGTAPNVAAALEFTDVSAIGHRGGTVKYKKSGCEFRLELVSAQDIVIQYQEKQGNALKKLLCGTGTLVKIELRGPAQATATASNPKTGRVLGSVELVKR